jgi:hypothetical protein
VLGRIERSVSILLKVRGGPIGGLPSTIIFAPGGTLHQVSDQLFEDLARFGVRSDMLIQPCPSSDWDATPFCQIEALVGGLTYPDDFGRLAAALFDEIPKNYP